MLLRLRSQGDVQGLDILQDRRVARACVLELQDPIHRGKIIEDLGCCDDLQAGLTVEPSGDVLIPILLRMFLGRSDPRGQEEFRILPVINEGKGGGRTATKYWVYP